MKKITALAVLATVFCLCLSKPSVVSADFEYPITPELENTQDIVALLQLNDAKDSMDTAELLDVVLEYPYLGDIYLANSFDRVVDDFAATFDGIAELLVREDAAAVLLEKHALLVKDVNNVDHAEQMLFVELALVHPNVYKQLDVTAVDQLFKQLDLVLDSDRVFNDVVQDGMKANADARADWYQHQYPVQAVEVDSNSTAETEAGGSLNILISLPFLSLLFYGFYRFFR